MSRLPIPGSDDGTWGNVLNQYLSVAHASDGSLNGGTVGTGQLQDNAVTNAKLDAATKSAISKANAAVQSTVATAKGDLLVASAAATITNVGVGTNGQVLTADSSQSTGVKWAATSSANGLPAGGSANQVLAKNTATDYDTLWANGVPLAQSGQVPGQEPVAPVASASGLVGTFAQAARADHVHPSAGLYTLYGDGSDGNLTLNGTNTYTSINIGKSGNTYYLSAPVYAANVTVASGITLEMHGHTLFVSGTLTNNGTITGPVGNASGATGGMISDTNAFRNWTLGTPNGVPANGTTANSTYPVGTGNYGCGKGGRGGTGTSGTPPDPNTNWNYSGGMDPARFYFRQPMASFTGRAIIQDNANRSQGNQLTGSIIPGGCPGTAGAGDGTNSGGGAGDGGAVVILCARQLTGSGTITAPGGNGGNAPAGNCGGGGGGGGGAAVVNTTSTAGWTGTVTAPGGAGGTGVGSGTAGAAGNTGVALLIVRQ